ncbi:MAG: hypothetical protein KBD85_02970 [Elusimicrobia bacterium]|nr:hypothetical protein [Elusimicrobiota bacterium]
MKIKFWFRFCVVLGAMAGAFVSDLRAEVTRDQVREEVERQLKAEESVK